MPLALLHGLEVESGREGDEAVVRLRGSLAESARVFDGLEARFHDGAVEVRVLATFVLWKRRGSPDFDATARVRAGSEAPEIRYRQPDGSTVPLGTPATDPGREPA